MECNQLARFSEGLRSEKGIGRWLSQHRPQLSTIKNRE